MRLLLTVQRHALPPTQVLWTVTKIRPPYTAAGSNGTISQLLEEVNDVIPLESEHWGLEDYVVEVRGFECLHFAESTEVLKDEDEVVIRPLQTYDLRSRKVSGRDQIAHDGKHLIDGVAFGRPFLRRAERPAISIPPRKRRRILYASSEDDELNSGDTTNGEVVLRANFVNADEDVDDDSQEDEDYVLADEDKIIQEDELRDLQTDFGSVQASDESRYSKAAQKSVRPSKLRDLQGTIMRSNHTVQGLGLDAEGVVKLVDEQGRPFPGAYSNALLDHYASEEASPDTVRLPASRKRKSAIGRSNTRTTLGHSTQDTANNNKRRRSSSSSKSVRFKAPGYDLSGGNLADEEDDSMDEDFTPDGAVILNEESDKENFKPGAPRNDSSTVTSISESESSDSQSSVSSSSSSSSSSDEDSSDSEPEEIPSHLESNPPLEKAIAESPETRPSGNNLPKQPQDDRAPTKTVPPGQGLIRTRKRNERRRAQKKVTALKDSGLVNRKEWPVKGNRGQARGLVSSMLKAVVAPRKTLDEGNSFESKRKELLDSIASGGVELGVPEPPRSLSVANDPATNDDPLIHAHTYDQASTSDIASEPLSRGQPASEPSKRKARLDLASSRQLLFGSLGLRTPKTKDEEHTLREKLAEQAKSAVVSVKFQADKRDPGLGGPVSQMEEEMEDDDSWKSKVILKAVECCHDDMALSVPPFPFVQRWDPRQQGVSKARNKGGKSKKRKRNQSQYYQKWEQEYEGQESPQLDQEDVDDRVHVQHYEADQTQSHAQPESDEIDGAVNDQLMRDANGISAVAPRSVEGPDDLALLPEDLSPMPALTKEDVLPGAIIAFKQLEMSQSTNWQPKISDYRTATVLEIKDSETLQVRLSQRDRTHNNKSYDDETGERVYAKFEMPDFDDEGAAEDGGFLEIMFGDLIEPKLVQAMESQSTATLEQHAMDVGQEQSNAETGEAKAEQGPELSSSEKALGLEKAQVDIDPTGVNDEVRKEIIQLMKDVGFRSSIGLDAVYAEEDASHGDSPALKDQETLDEEHTHVHDAGSSSPRFNGLGSSPAAEEAIGADPSSPPRQTSIPKEVRTPIPDMVGQDRAEDGLNVEGPNSPRNGDEKLEIESARLDEDKQQPPVNAIEHTPNTVRQKLRKQLQNLFAPSSPSVAASIAEPSTKTPPKATGNPISGFDGALSDDDFPSLDSVLSTARSSFETTAPKQNGKQRSASPENKVPIALSSPQATPHVEATNGAAAHISAPRRSQPPAGSQVLDLTLSSDPVDPDDDDGEYRDGAELPNGPGRVKKRKLRSGSSAKVLGKRPYRSTRRI